MRLEIQTGREKTMWQEWGPWAFGLLLYVISLCHQGLLGLDNIYTTSSDDRMLLYAPSFMA